MQKILLFDNYDSFTFNLLHYVEQFAEVKVDVFRNNEIELESIKNYDAIIFSPGPGLPVDAGIMNLAISMYAPSKKILGVCLGMQAIVVVFGGKLKNLETVRHGISKRVIVSDGEDLLFKNIPSVFNAGRYHSWVADKNAIPDCIKVTAKDDDDQVMAIRHSDYNVYGVQFHPESVLTDYGLQLIENWIAI